MFARGAFGNTILQFDSIEELLQARAAGEFDGLVMLRFRKPDGPVRKDLTIDDAEAATHELVASGKWKYDDIYFNEVLERQDELVAIQGELMAYDPQRPEQGMHLFYNDVQMRMREAMRAKPKVATGWRAKALLELHCDPSSFDCLMEILELYPDHVIEFTCLKQAIGSMSSVGRNTIVREVRKF